MFDTKPFFRVNGNTYSLNLYFKELSKIKLLSSEEETELSYKARRGSISAKKRLVVANLRFVVSIAKQYQGLGLDLEDLINEGNSGLLKAVDNFDETRGFKFISYAVWWIRRSILNSLLANSRIVRIPVNKAGKLQKINREFERLIQVLEREPTSGEIAESMEIKRSEAMEMIELAANGSSEYQDYYNVDMVSELNIDDTIDGYDLFVSMILDSDILSENEREVLILYYGLNGFCSHILEDIGNIIGRSSESVRQTRDRAIKKIKDSSLKDSLREFL